MKLTTLILGCALSLGVSLVCAQTHQPGATFGADPASLKVTAATPAQGAPDSTVNVQIDYAGLPRSGVAVTYRTEQGLMLLGAASKRLTPDSKGAAQDTVAVKAAYAGVYYVNVFVATRSVTKVVSIPVTVGNAMFKPSAARSVATPGGERVIEMPAQQTVR